MRPGVTPRDIALTADIHLMSSFVVASEREGNAKAITLRRDSLGVKNIVSIDAFGGLAGNPADLAMRLHGVEGESWGQRPLPADPRIAPEPQHDHAGRQPARGRRFRRRHAQVSVPDGRLGFDRAD
jgi:hypothetical protein